uniref:Uncharacterized protein n=1 Tax=Panthera tigris altaica TaxID=74533 RepID=A0A8C9KIQ4_PANTA
IIGLHFCLGFRCIDINISRKSMTVCQVKLIMYVSLSPSLSIHCYRFVSYNNVYCIDWTLKNEPELVILYTFPTFASPTPCSHVFGTHLFLFTFNFF